MKWQLLEPRCQQVVHSGIYLFCLLKMEIGKTMDGQESWWWVVTEVIDLVSGQCRSEILCREYLVVLHPKSISTASALHLCLGGSRGGQGQLRETWSSHLCRDSKLWQQMVCKLFLDMQVVWPWRTLSLSGSYHFLHLVTSQRYNPTILDRTSGRVGFECFLSTPEIQILHC